MLNQSTVLLQSEIQISPLVLVVDDCEDNITYACCSLELFNYRYVIATNGDDALNLAKDKLPDVILLDIVMPDIDGISVTRILKANPRTSHIPIIATTGLAYPHYKEQIMNAGCDAYLCKPYSIEDLEDRLVCFSSYNDFQPKNSKVKKLKVTSK